MLRRNGEVMALYPELILHFCLLDLYTLNLYCISWPLWLHTSWSQSRVHSVHHKKPSNTAWQCQGGVRIFHRQKGRDISPLWKICIKFNAIKHYLGEGSFLWKTPAVFTVWVMFSLIVVYCRVWGIFCRRFMVTFCDVFRRGRKGRRGQ